ncbi:MAG: hypothetical protein LBE10_13165 [Treponema sp.]|jgi:hypothetical protein|nr:hypothetical protein [Treponema sp.]
MAKNKKAIYAPGELARVRGKLGVDESEAKRMARILGGEVGYERTEEQVKPRPRRVRHETVEVVVGNKGGKSRGDDRNRPRRTTELPADETRAQAKQSRKRESNSDDDPAVPVRSNYFDRLRMDRFAGQPEFDIKSAGQVLSSMLAVFGEVPDYVSPLFTNKRFPEYYKRIEQLVTCTRTLFPRNNMKRNEKLRRTSPFVYAVLDTIRYWNIEKIASDFSKIQSHPRNAKMIEFADILRAIYRPLFVLELLDIEAHLKGAYKLLYKLLYIENPMDAKEKYQDLIRNSLVSFGNIRREIHYLLYPMLLKLLSNRYISYERFFVERKNRFLAFIGAQETDRIDPASMTSSGEIDGDEKAEEMEEVSEAEGNETAQNLEEGESEEDEDPDDPKVIERKAKKKALEAEKKALNRGIATLEALFPRAGWDRLSSFPDLYPYFTDMLSLKKGYELIAPTDPLQQVVILLRVLEELFFALRYVTFGVIAGVDGQPVKVEEYLNPIINNWRNYIDQSFVKVYLPRLTEYCNILENTADSRNSNYVKRLINELHWAKRIYFLPHYKFESIMTSPFQKNAINPLYPEIRILRKYLTAVAAGIEQGNRQGGAEAMAPCDGIDNPWEPYNFEVPNPLSRRLDALLALRKRNNAALIFFTLSVSTVLDHLVNNETSWAYESRPGPLFRSLNGEGNMPLFGVDTKIDADVIFKQEIRKKAKQTDDGISEEN